MDGTDFVLVWQGGQATIYSRGVFFRTAEKPALSFGYDVLDCETQTGVYFRMVGDAQILLSDEQVAECGRFCEAWYETGDYDVYAYDPGDENLYKGKMLKSSAEAAGYGWSVTERPDGGAAAWNEATGSWTVYYAAITDDGRLLTAIDHVCSRCAWLLTREEFDALPVREHDTDTWDFGTGTWADHRDLAKVKSDALLDVRTRFEALRWKLAGEYVPDYERETWRTQLAEARAWLADGTADTPYLDAFLEAREDDDVPTKTELAEEIVANDRAYVRAMAGASAKLWWFKKRIASAVTGYAVDDIRGEAAAYVQEARR